MGKERGDEKGRGGVREAEGGDGGGVGIERR